MYQAITTKYLGATAHRGARIVARAQAGKVTVAWDHSLNQTENHAAAARALAHKFGWADRWYGGATLDGYVFVRLDSYGECAFEVEDSTRPDASHRRHTRSNRVTIWRHGQVDKPR